MVIRVERDPTFWAQVVAHPSVSAAVGQISAAQIADIIRRPGVLPLAAEHGGFLFSTLDGLGRVRELHTVFTPEGWGREAFEAAREAFEKVFSEGADLVVTYEVEDNARSQPPRSFRFRPVGEMRSSPLGEVRLWMLTRNDWLACPARRHMCQ